MAQPEQEGSSSSIAFKESEFTIIQDKMINFDRLEDLASFQIKEKLETSGWLPYLEIEEDLHNEEWRQFYENVVINPSKPSYFKTNVNGKELKISERLIRKITRCASEGLKVYNNSWIGDGMMTNTGTLVTEAVITQAIYEELAFLSSKQVSSMLLPIGRVIQLINNQILLPRASSRALVRPADSYIIYNMIQGNMINFPNLVYSHLRATISRFLSTK